MSNSRSSQRRTKTSAAPGRRVFLLTNLSRRSARELSTALDDKIETIPGNWRLSVRHGDDLSPDDITALPADALIVDGIDSPRMQAARRGSGKLISTCPHEVTGAESLQINSYLAGAVAADIMLRRGHRKFVAADDENPQLLSGFTDEIALAGLTGESIDIANDEFAPPKGSISASFTDPQITADQADKIRYSSSLICIGERIAECAFTIEPSAQCMASVLAQWLKNSEKALPDIPPHPVSDDLINQLSDAFSAPAISSVSAYIDAMLSRGKGCKIDAIADQFSVARRTLERRFRDVAGTSLHKEITRRQVARARQNLFEPGATPATAAAASGYPSTRMLSINFSKLTGMSPRAYQKEKILSPL